MLVGRDVHIPPCCPKPLRVSDKVLEGKWSSKISRSSHGVMCRSSVRHLKIRSLSSPLRTCRRNKGPQARSRPQAHMSSSYQQGLIASSGPDMSSSYEQGHLNSLKPRPRALTSSSLCIENVPEEGSFGARPAMAELYKKKGRSLAVFKF